MKAVRLSGHAREQLFFRGVAEGEVLDAIHTSQWQAADLGRMECRKNFEFEKEWNKKYYKTKQVRPVFVEEEKEIIVVTIYSYFFSEEA